MVLTDRDRRVISDIGTFRTLTREQIAQLGHFRSKTRANAILLRLVRGRYLDRRFQPTLSGTRRSVYLLGPGGAQLMGLSESEARRVSRRNDAASLLFLDHLLLVNEVRLAFHRERRCEVERWYDEDELRSRSLGVVPDAGLEYRVEGKHFAAFVEVDRGTETLARLRQKAEAYLRLATSGRYERTFRRRFFRVLVVAPSERRVENIRRAIAPVTERIFWLATVESLARNSVLSAIWRRPADQTRHALTEA